MTQFDDREKAEERNFARHEEADFKAQARRNKILGNWVAEILGLTGEAAEKYVTSVVVADLAEKGDEDVFKKIWTDLQNANSDVTEHVVRRQMSDFLAQAIKELES